MRTLLSTVSAVAVVTALALPARAQFCPDPEVIQCGDAVSGNTSGGPDWLVDYSCDVNQWKGPEAHYLLAIDQCVELTMTLEPSGFDAALFVLPRVAGTCRADLCQAIADSGSTSYTEVLEATAAPGAYSLVIDGYESFFDIGYGPYTLTIDCTPHPECSDADGDGFYADDGSCPCGDDCADDDAARHPAAFEVCEDGIDQDCDGFDRQCPDCTPTDELSCNLAGSTDMGALADNIHDWCGLGENNWYGNEAILTLQQPSPVGVVFETVSAADIDLFAVRPAGPGVCDPQRCITWVMTDSGDERIAFYAHADQTIYLVADGWGYASPEFDWTASCYDQACTAGPAIACGQTVSGDTSNGSNAVDIYDGIGYTMPAPEAVHTFSPEGDALVNIDLDFAAGIDLALLVLEDSGRGCHPADLVAAADLDNTTVVGRESLSLQTVAGVTYYVVIDGWDAADQGAYDLSIDCVSICPAGTTDCGGVCVDTQTDLDHCGGCGQACAFAHAAAECVGGVCQLGACDAGWDDCDGDPQTGCEADLNSDVTCGSCDNSCTAPAFCHQGACTEQCPGELTNCGGVCVDTDTDSANCGSCGHVCSFDHAAASCVGGECQLGACDDGWADCDADPATGCETDLLTDPDFCGDCDTQCGGDTPFCVAGSCSGECPGDQTNCGGVCVDTQTDAAHCGGCDQPCAFDHAAAECVAGVCRMGACDDGWADCDADPATGCETELGTLDHCGGCGDACAAAHAENSCVDGSCQVGGCDDGWGDCDADAANGCETELGTLDDCGACGDTCDFAHADGACVDGGCQMGECHTSYADCNGDPADGCEADLRSEASCGSCDNACGETEDCDGGECVSSCRDLDGDGHQAESCGGDDCNDYDANTYPGAPEVCGDGVDQDCDGADQSCGDCHDRDGDGHQDASCGGDDCDDADADVHPGATEICGDGIDQDCDGADQSCGDCQDQDGDGHQDAACGGSDCDDNDPDVHPGAAEICGDGIDQDCDGQDQTCGGCTDADGDGHTPVNCGGLDCDDSDPNSYPGAEEICGDGIDQDCDGLDPACPDSGGCGCSHRPGRAGGWLALLALLGSMGAVEYRRRRRC